jgi:GNAT superfamily N-acetyltransferase
MFNERIHRALVNDPELLANKLHTKYIYEANLETQRKVKELVDSLLKNYSDSSFVELGFNSETKKLIRKVITLKKEPNWEKIIRKFLFGMKHLLEREISRAKRLEKPKKVLHQIRKELRKIHIYHRKDVLSVEEIKDGIVKVHYLSRLHSPEYDGNRGQWRDTEFTFTLNFNKNLFVWVHISIHSKLRGEGMGSKLVKFCERLAKDLGIRRFSVEWPNRKYWQKQGYSIPHRYRIGSDKKGYTHEGYKEV